MARAKALGKAADVIKSRLASLPLKMKEQKLSAMDLPLIFK